MRRLLEVYEDDITNFDEATEAYMPSTGEGDSMLTQLLVAANRIIRKWYEDGDVIDTCNGLGWESDISGSANWIDKYAPAMLSAPFKRVFDCCSNQEYQEQIIDPFKASLDKYFESGEWRKLLNAPKRGNAYNEKGIYEFNIFQTYEFAEPDEDYEDYEDDEDEYYESRTIKENYMDSDEDISYPYDYDSYDEYESFAEIPEQKPIRYKGFSIYRGTNDSGAETYYCFYDNDDYPEPGYEDWSADTLEQAKEWCDYYEFDDDDDLE